MEIQYNVLQRTEHLTLTLPQHPEDLGSPSYQSPL